MQAKSFGHVVVLLLVLSCISAPVVGQGLGGLMPCRDGDTRPCGSAVGVCEKGTSTCQEGMWGSCEGGVPAGDEDCSDGLDNDCNGLVDDCGFNTVSIILIGTGCMLLVVALIVSKMGK